MRAALLRSRVLSRLAICGLGLLALTHCGEEGRASRFPDSQLQDRLPPGSELDAALPDEDELDASAPPADTGEDAGDEFVKYWDGSTTPTADYVRHVDAGEVDVRGSDVPSDASAP
jgi:hypothetical protein